MATRHDFDKLAQRSIEQERWNRLIEIVYEEIKGDKSLGRINPEDFLDIYDNAKITSDLAYVKRRTSQFESTSTYEEKQIKKLAEIFEGVIAQQSSWLEGEVAIASLLDDIAHGIDCFVEYPDQEKPGSASRLALAIDATFSNITDKKFKAIQEEIRKGTLSRATYYQSKTYKGSLAKIPRVVVGVDFYLLKELMGLYLVSKKGTSTTKRKSADEKLSNHIVSHYILRQIKTQLKTFGDYAKLLEEKDPRLPKNSEIFNRDWEVVNGIYRRKGSEQAIMEFEHNGGINIVDGQIYESLKNGFGLDKH